MRIPIDNCGDGCHGLRCNEHGILLPMKPISWMGVLLLAASGPVQAAVYSLTAQQWAVPRSARSVLAMPALQQALHALQKNPAARLELRYPGGDAGTLWMSELQSWLVALGVPHASMESIPGSSKTNVIELEIVLPAKVPGSMTRSKD